MAVGNENLIVHNPNWYEDYLRLYKNKNVEARDVQDLNARDLERRLGGFAGEST